MSTGILFAPIEKFLCSGWLETVTHVVFQRLSTKVSFPVCAGLMRSNQDEACLPSSVTKATEDEISMNRSDGLPLFYLCQYFVFLFV